jgi:hypothetical protein
MASFKKNREKGISRIDSVSTHGWFVRGYRNGKTFSKLFSDLKNGGKDSALSEARAFRERLNQQLGEIPTKPRSRRVVTRDARNTTGVIGVCRTSKRTPRGKLHLCYSVSWRPERGVQKCTSFSISKYGEEKAFALAVALRRKMIQEINPPSRKDSTESP